MAEVATLLSGPWMLREAAKMLGLPEEAVDVVLRSQNGVMSDDIRSLEL